MTEEQMWSEFIKELEEIEDYNNSILEGFGPSALLDFENLVEDVNTSGKIEFVDAPKGMKQDEEYGIFKDVHVEQWSVGDSGDSFNGHIYALVGEKWIKIYYNC